MVCPCCSPKNVNDLDNTFAEKQAKRDANAYLKKGLSGRAEKLIDYIGRHSQKPLSVLDIGCGAGGVHQELLRRKVAKSVVGVDASSAYLTAASRNAHTLGLSEAIHYHHADFAQNPEAFDAADLVILDRVICCYPYLQQLLGEAAVSANQFLALSFPYTNLWVQIPFKIINFGLTLIKSGYHPYLHPHDQVIATAEQKGLRIAHEERHFLWRILVFEATVGRRPSTAA